MGADRASERAEEPFHRADRSSHRRQGHVILTNPRTTVIARGLRCWELFPTARPRCVDCAPRVWVCMSPGAAACRGRSAARRRGWGHRTICSKLHASAVAIVCELTAAPGLLCRGRCGGKAKLVEMITGTSCRPVQRIVVQPRLTSCDRPAAGASHRQGKSKDDRARGTRPLSEDRPTTNRSSLIGGHSRNHAVPPRTARLAAS
jgi:hypothetical protein